MAAISTYARQGWIRRLIRMPGGDAGSAVARSGKFPVWRWVILLIAAVYFLLPLYAAIRFAGVKAFGSVFTQPGFGAALWTSIQIARHDLGYHDGADGADHDLRAPATARHAPFP